MTAASSSSSCPTRDEQQVDRQTRHDNNNFIRDEFRSLRDEFRLEFRFVKDESRLEFRSLRDEVRSLRDEVDAQRAEIRSLKDELQSQQVDFQTLFRDSRQSFDMIRIEQLKTIARSRNACLTDPYLPISPIPVYDETQGIIHPDPMLFPKNAEELLCMCFITTEHERRMLTHLVGFYNIPLPPPSEIGNETAVERYANVAVTKLYSLFNMRNLNATKKMTDKLTLLYKKRPGPDTLEQEEAKRRRAMQTIASGHRQQTTSTTHPPNSQSSVGLANTNIGPRVSNSSNGVVMVNGSAQPSREQVQQRQKETTGGGTVAITSTNSSPRVQSGNSGESR